MNKEDFVSYELAKDLRKKGYDELCCAEYTYGKHLYINYFYDIKNSSSTIAAPTLYDVLKWLINSKGICIDIKYISNHFYFEIVDMSTERTLSTEGGNSLEEGLSNAIKESLKFI